jgi:hypothetical protein
MRDLRQVEVEIARSGLVSRGALRLAEGERTGGLEDLATIVLVGIRGGEGWSAFEDAAEHRDGLPDPLDRCSRRIIDGVARACGARSLYPFDGPPYWPFQRWAMRAEAVHVSPLGMLIHPEYGLWHSYRGALGFVEAFRIPPLERRASPCEACATRPCLTACPVDAFTSRGYDTDACTGYLRSDAGRACMGEGCVARRACPVGAEYAQGRSQAAFHMRAFLDARAKAAR